jgi:DNA-damage-inducible protein D
MSEQIPTAPDFDSIKQISPYGIEYWSARDLGPLLGYDKWQRFEDAIKRGQTACQQVGQVVENHFTASGKMVTLGSGAQREVKDFILSRFGAYLIAQNGDPRKPEIAAAQVYFAIRTRSDELRELKETQDKRVELRERLTENNKALAEAAHQAGVLPRDFGIFQEAGYKGLYDGLGVAGLKERKGIPAKDDLLDRMGAEELAANDFRATQATAKLRREQIIGQTAATQAHHQVGQEVREAIKRIGGTMPEELPAQPSIKPLIEERKRKRKKLPKATAPQPSLFDEPEDNH